MCIYMYYIMSAIQGSLLNVKAKQIHYLPQENGHYFIF